MTNENLKTIKPALELALWQIKSFDKEEPRRKGRAGDQVDDTVKAVTNALQALDAFERGVGESEVREAESAGQGVEVLTVDEFVERILPSVPKSDETVGTFKAIYHLIVGSGMKVIADKGVGNG